MTYAAPQIPRLSMIKRTCWDQGWRSFIHRPKANSPSTLLGRAVLASALVCLGCSGGGRTTPGDRQPADVVESWDAIFVTGKHVGHSVTRTDTTHIAGAARRRIQNETQLHIQRFGDPTLQTIWTQSIETLDGQAVSFESVMTSGDGKTEARGQRRGDRIDVVTTAGGQSKTGSFDIPADCRGYYGIEHCLTERPMQPGEQRKLDKLEPFFHGFSRVELSAVAMERTETMDGARRLLRIACRMNFPAGQSIEMTLWADARGEVVKTMAGNLQSSYRTTKATAIAHASGNLDLGTRLSVAVEASIENPHQTQRVEYRARFASGDPMAIFPNSPGQVVRPVDKQTCAVVVSARRPKPQPDGPNDGSMDRSYLEGNSMLSIDDPLVREMAAAVASTESDPWRIAVALEGIVRDTVSDKNFSTALASASEVARSKAGDCTEHTVLLAALCRVRGIPARAAIGLIYDRASSAFIHHMWTEVWIRGDWYPIDGTLGLGGVGACHLKVSDTDFRHGVGFDSVLPVLRLFDNLSLEIVNVEQ
jgi:hypothetical protein